MNPPVSLRAKLSTPAQSSLVSGHWRTIKLCLDEDAGEFFNVGVLFAHGGHVEVRMLDTFERVKCLFDTRVHTDDLSRLLHDIEATVIQLGPELPDSLGETIRLGPPLYAAGPSAEAVVDEFFDDVVTLGRPKRARRVAFRYQSTPKLRNTLFDLMRERMQLQASQIIQQKRYQLRLRTGHQIELDVPLMSGTASGTVVSAWYKSPLVVENNLLQASADLNLVRSNTDRARAAISVLVPDRDSGLTHSEFNKLNTATRHQLDRIQMTGIDVLEAGSTTELADLTIAWWRDRSAA